MHTSAACPGAPHWVCFLELCYLLHHVAKENICLKTVPDILDWSPAWAWLLIPSLSVNRRMFHVAANYSHNILHPMYLVTMLCPRLPLPDIISPFSHRNENINSLASRFSFSRPFWDLWAPTSPIQSWLKLTQYYNIHHSETTWIR